MNEDLTKIFIQFKIIANVKNTDKCCVGSAIVRLLLKEIRVKKRGRELGEGSVLYHFFKIVSTYGVYYISCKGPDDKSIIDAYLTHPEYFIEK
ncbi:hypothetical protein [Mucilaginibacter sp.]|uniref:hypothetical protein n=1 Tax=Mucilaginibacter sp. TaxID=1882438 RepID=UPI003D12C740